MNNGLLVCFREGLLATYKSLGGKLPSEDELFERVKKRVAAPIGWKDPLERMEGFRARSEFLLQLAQAAMGTHDWGGFESAWRDHEALMLEAKHAEIDFDRQAGRIPQMNRKLASSRLSDIRADSEWLGFIAKRMEEVKKREKEGS